ncbi:kinesin-like protein KIF9 [Bacillus rossius redtenbacheri]|uniref:kinesin-like protein KIF9 n=1 Tax=Bacillus rossius redtenbacheri TaxID=93214 RepID=UPI002FDCF743
MEKQLRSKNTKVFVKILPVENMSHENLKIETNYKVMYVRRLQDFGKGAMQFSTLPSFWRFQTDGIFFNASQEEIYASVMEDVVESALRGCDSVVLANGQTGSGKSYTISGGLSQCQRGGLLPRLLAHLFGKREDLQLEASVSLALSMVEIRDGKLTDLLGTPQSVARRDALKAVTVVPVHSDAEAAKLARRGDSRRCVAAGAPYPSSHVAHSVATVHVESRSLVRSAPTTARAKIHLVDMAGVNLVTKQASAWLDHHQISGANLDRLLLGRYLDQLRAAPSTVCSRTSSTLIRYLGDSLDPASVLR